MLSMEDLRQKSKVDVLSVDACSLTDIGTVSLNASSPINERLESYLAQVQNPYIFLCCETRVKISFSDTGRTLDSSLIRYFTNLNNN